LRANVVPLLKISRFLKKTVEYALAGPGWRVRKRHALSESDEPGAGSNPAAAPGPAYVNFEFELLGGDRPLVKPAPATINELGSLAIPFWLVFNPRARMATVVNRGRN
jgi:hypothetical protein